MRGVFYNDQVFDASVFAARHILSAKKSIFLIDSWVDVVTLELLAKKAKGTVRISLGGASMWHHGLSSICKWR